MRRWPHLRWVFVAILLALPTGIVWLAVAAFNVPLLTPFAATVETTALDFTVAGDEGPDADLRELGPLAGSRIMDFKVRGCVSLERSDPARSEPCEEDSLEVKRGQLSHVELPAGTRVALWLTSDAVAMKLSPPKDGDEVRIFVTALAADPSIQGDVGTRFGDTLRPAPGEWRVTPSGRVVELVLREEPNEPLMQAESDIRLSNGSSVLFEKEGKRSALVGATNTLLLPELPKDIEAMTLPRGVVAIRRLQGGTIRHLGLTHTDGRLQSLAVELTGSSKELMVPDIYSDKPQNEALTFFDRNSGKDRKLRIIAVMVLVLGVITLFSSLLGLAEHWVTLWLAYLRWKLTRKDEKALDTLRVWYRPEAVAFEDAKIQNGEGSGHANVDQDTGSSVD